LRFLLAKADTADQLQALPEPMDPGLILETF